MPQRSKATKSNENLAKEKEKAARARATTIISIMREVQISPPKMITMQLGEKSQRIQSCRTMATRIHMAQTGITTTVIVYNIQTTVMVVIVACYQ